MASRFPKRAKYMSVTDMVEVYKQAADQLAQDLSEVGLSEFIDGLETDIPLDKKEELIKVTDDIISSEDPQMIAENLLELRRYIVRDIPPEALSRTFVEEFISDSDIYGWAERVAEHGPDSKQNDDYAAKLISDELSEYVNLKGIFQKN